MGGRAGYIDKDGKFAINPQFDSGAPFSDGLAAVRMGSAWGFIDHSGRVVIPAKFQVPGPMPLEFAEGLAAVNQGPGTPIGFIDKNGNMVIAPQFEYALRFSNGLALVGVG